MLSPRISFINIPLVLTTIKGISQKLIPNSLIDSRDSNFTQFYSTKSERERNLKREYEAQMEYRKHLQAFIDRWRYNANRAAQAQSKIKILEKVRMSLFWSPTYLQSNILASGAHPTHRRGNREVPVRNF